MAKKTDLEWLIDDLQKYAYQTSKRAAQISSEELCAQARDSIDNFYRHYKKPKKYVRRFKNFGYNPKKIKGKSFRSYYRESPQKTVISGGVEITADGFDDYYFDSFGTTDPADVLWSVYHGYHGVPGHTFLRTDTEDDEGNIISSVIPMPQMSPSPYEEIVSVKEDIQNGRQFILDQAAEYAQTHFKYKVLKF